MSQLYMSVPAPCINKSGLSVPVVNLRNMQNVKVGNLLANEIFGACIGEMPGEAAVVYRNSSGARSDMWIQQGAISDANWDKVLKPLGDYPYGTVIISGKTYKTLKARRLTSIIKPAGGSWGSVAKDCLIALANSSVSNQPFGGESNFDYIAVAYVQSSAGAWVQATGDGLNHCFAPIGLDVGSGASTVNFIGAF